MFKRGYTSPNNIFEKFFFYLGQKLHNIKEKKGSEIKDKSRKIKKILLEKLKSINHG